MKVLDFGLAKAMGPPSLEATAGKPGDGMNSPTLTAHATQMGMILGTAAYMAPEQARGKPVDRRADIWAFGAVLYEMVSGRRAFAGEELSDVLAAVLRQDIDWSALPAGTPPGLRQLLERCLERDPKQRLRDIGEARIAIDELLRHPGAASVATVLAAPVPPAQTVVRPRSPLPLVLGLTAAAACGAVAAWLFLTSRTAAPETALASHDGLVRASIELPETAPLRGRADANLLDEGVQRLGRLAFGDSCRVPVRPRRRGRHVRDRGVHVAQEARRRVSAG